MLVVEEGLVVIVKVTVPLVSGILKRIPTSHDEINLERNVILLLVIVDPAVTTKSEVDGDMCN